MRPELCLPLHLPLPHSVSRQPPTSPPRDPHDYLAALLSPTAPLPPSESAPTSGTSTGVSCKTDSGVQLNACCRRAQLKQCHKLRIAAGKEEPC